MNVPVDGDEKKVRLTMWEVTELLGRNGDAFRLFTRELKAVLLCYTMSSQASFEYATEQAEAIKKHLAEGGGEYLVYLLALVPSDYESVVIPFSEGIKLKESIGDACVRFTEVPLRDFDETLSLMTGVLRELFAQGKILAPSRSSIRLVR